jgi:hemerythrin-like metal-binding protein
MNATGKNDTGGIAHSINHHHMKIMQAIDALVTAAKHGKSIDFTATLYQYLVNTIELHFEDEERVMLREVYPEYQAHKAAHKRFLEVDLHKLQAEFEVRGARFSFTLVLDKALRDWWTSHVLGDDARFSEWLNGRRLKEDHLSA